MKPKRMSPTPMHAQRGFSLIEAMVALLVLSVGLIGIAALHTQGLSASRTALYRTTAVNLAADMADRIRVNRIAGAAYNNAAAVHNCVTADCSPEDLAENDLSVWEALVDASLPDGAGEVTADTGTDPTTYTIDVTWNEAGDGERTFTTVVQIPEI